MSTYWYFECRSHAPSLRSEEFSQHTGDAHFERGITLAGLRPLDEQRTHWQGSTDQYFDNNARSFLGNHPACTIGFVNEYGEEHHP